jgi:Leucine-rich repeat (LRR) protein
VFELFRVEAEEKIVICEKVQGARGDQTFYCALNRATIITNDFKISWEKNEKFIGLNFESNKKIFYLPESPFEIFPYLKYINALECSIKEISYKNFKNLEFLRYLYLNENQIGAIATDTFKDLLNLEEIYLREKII